MFFSWPGFFVALVSIASAAECPSPKLLVSPYIPPWQTLPPTPTLVPKTSGYVETDDGAKIWYGLSGSSLHQSSSSSPVLFLHGGFANSNYFANQIACLASEYPIISIDSRGHGRSFDGPGPITYDRMTLDVIEVLDHLSVPKVSIVGWSDGGIIALDLAMNFTHRVDRIFAYGASYVPGNINASIGDSPTFNAYLTRVVQEYKDLSPTPDHLDAFEEKVNTMWADLPQWDAESFATIPTLQEDQDAPLIFIVDGEQEEAVNRDVPFTLRDWIPLSQLMLLPGVSHFGMLQDPETYTTAVARVLSYH